MLRGERRLERDLLRPINRDNNGRESRHDRSVDNHGLGSLQLNISSGFDAWYKGWFWSCMIMMVMDNGGFCCLYGYCWDNLFCCRFKCR